MQVIQRGSETFDAVVVGSGATGGWAAKTLTEGGLNVCLLEAGPTTTPAEFSEHAEPYQYPYRFHQPVLSPNQPVQRTIYACREMNKDWFVNDIENPYTTPDEKPFTWIRQRRLGGRSLSWGRQSYRLSDLDFKAASHDGHGVDWPISYKDIEPVYEELPGWSESTVGLTSVDQLPENAKAYIRFLEEQIEAPIDVISTGPDRIETITLRHPFGE